MSIPKNEPYFFTWDNQNSPKCFKIKKTEECFYVQDDNSKITDLTSVSYHAPLGFSHKEIKDSIITQVNDYSITSTKNIHDLKSDVSKMLLDFLKVKSGKIFYTLSGAESVENAFKIARDFTGKKTIASRKISYHGATLGALSATGDWRNTSVETFDQWTLRIPEAIDDLDGSKTINKLKDNNDLVAAVILETVTGGNGVFIPSEDYLLNIQEYCNKNNIIFILDEVICGFYRLGTPFGFHSFSKIKPDMVCMAKGMTAGYIPFGALYVNKKISSSYDNKTLPCGLTNYAHPLGLAVTKKVIEVMSTSKFISNQNKLITKFHNELISIEKLKQVKQVRKIGLLSAIDLNFEPCWESILEKNIYLLTAPKRILLAPMFIMSEELLEKSMLSLKKYLEKNDVS